MTSPYLERPRRNIVQALKDRGMSPDEIGWQQGEEDSQSPEIHSRSLISSGWAYRLLACLLVTASGLAFAYSLVETGPRIASNPALQPDLIDESGELEEISPAAGPDADGEPAGALPEIIDLGLEPVPTLEYSPPAE